MVGPQSETRHRAPERVAMYSARPLLDHESFETCAEATAAIADYVDGSYNVHRPILRERNVEQAAARVRV